MNPYLPNSGAQSTGSRFFRRAAAAIAFLSGPTVPVFHRWQSALRFKVAHKSDHWVRTFSKPHTVHRRK
ncbi:MAG TPA: hypothetical protein VGO67_20090, partial [Verrucomicrobiae bacterium]